MFSPCSSRLRARGIFLSETQGRLFAHEEHHGDCSERRRFFCASLENSEVPGRQEKMTHLDCIKKTKMPKTLTPAISQI